MWQYYIARLMRRQWGQSGLAPLTNVPNDQLDLPLLRRAIEGLAADQQAFAEEVATLGSRAPDYNSTVPITVQIDGQGAPTRDLPATCGNYLAGLYAANPSGYFAEYNGSTRLINGAAAAFCGPVIMTLPPRREHGTPAGGGTSYTYTEYNLFATSIRATNLTVNRLLWINNNGTTTSYQLADTGKVKVTTNDTLDYLREQMADFAAANTSSVRVYASVVNAALQLRYSANFSNVTSYSTTGDWVFGIRNGAPKFFGVTNC